MSTSKGTFQDSVPVSTMSAAQEGSGHSDPHKSTLLPSGSSQHLQSPSGLPSLTCSSEPCHGLQDCSLQVKGPSLCSMPQHGKLSRDMVNGQWVGGMLEKKHTHTAPPRCCKGHPRLWGKWCRQSQPTPSLITVQGTYFIFDFPHKV